MVPRRGHSAEARAIARRRAGGGGAEARALLPLTLMRLARARSQVMATIHTPGYSSGLSAQEMFDMKVKAK